MGRRIEVRSIVLQHPEAPREVTVLFDRRVHLCFEELLIPGPGHQFVVNRVTQIEHTRLPRRNSFEHRTLARTLRKKNHERDGKTRQNTGTANGRHLLPPSILTAAGCPALQQSRPCEGSPGIPRRCSSKQSAAHSSGVSFFSAP